MSMCEFSCVTARKEIKPTTVVSTGAGTTRPNPCATHFSDSARRTRLTTIGILSRRTCRTRRSTRSTALTMAAIATRRQSGCFRSTTTSTCWT